MKFNLGDSVYFVYCVSMPYEATPPRDIDVLCGKITAINQNIDKPVEYKIQMKDRNSSAYLTFKSNEHLLFISKKEALENFISRLVRLGDGV